MRYQEKRFQVPTGGRDPRACDHGWIRPNGECQFCGVLKIEARMGVIYVLPGNRVIRWEPGSWPALVSPVGHEPTFGRPPTTEDQ